MLPGCAAIYRVWAPIAVAILLCGGCNVQRRAVNSLADVLSGPGAIFASDNDPELIRDAAPFSLKLMESILAQTPNHRGLLSSTSSSFTQYAYAFIAQDADVLEATDSAAANKLRDRGRKLLMRARDYGLRGLEVAHPEFTQQLKSQPRRAVAVARKDDVPLLYWTAASWGLIITISKTHPDLVADQLAVEALIDRALELDESFDCGAIHSFLISYETVRQGASTPVEQRVRFHFRRAVELSEGQMAGPYVALAESISIQKQDRKEFESLLKQALSIDVDTRP